MPVKKDFWWQIDQHSSKELILAEVIENLQVYAIPQLKSLISTKDLQNELTKTIASGIGHPKHYLDLIALMLNSVPKDHTEIIAVVHKLRDLTKGRPSYYSIRESLLKLGINDF